jgi:hypothetical protein
MLKLTIGEQVRGAAARESIIQGRRTPDDPRRYNQRVNLKLLFFVCLGEINGFPFTGRKTEFTAQTPATAQAALRLSFGLLLGEPLFYFFKTFHPFSGRKFRHLCPGSGDVIEMDNVSFLFFQHG